MGGVDGAVRLAPRVTGRVVRAGVVTLPWLVLAALLLAGSGLEHEWATWLVLLVLLPTQVARWLVVVSAARQPWSVEIGADGVRWPGSSRPLAWSHVERVEVHLTRGLRRLLPHPADRVLLVTAVEADFADRARTAPMSRGIVLSQVRGTPAQVVAAIRRFSEVPVHGWPDGR